MWLFMKENRPRWQKGKTMTDYIKREDAIDIVADNNVTGEITLNRYDKIIDGIYDIPSADVAPVVRCKDCKWCEGYGYACVCHNPRYGDGYANYQPPHINDEYWCADGEREDNDTD